MGPLQRGRPEVADEYELLIRNYPNLRVVDVNQLVARQAAELRASARLRLADSLQIATALDEGASAVITNDLALARLRVPAVVIIDTFLN